MKRWADDDALRERGKDDDDDKKQQQEATNNKALMHQHKSAERRMNRFLGFFQPKIFMMSFLAVTSSSSEVAQVPIFFSA